MKYYISVFLSLGFLIAGGAAFAGDCSVETGRLSQSAAAERVNCLDRLVETLIGQNTALLGRIKTLEEERAGKEYVKWTAIHASASAACLAIGGPVSGSAHITIPRRAKVSCAATCRAHPSNFQNCKAMVAIGRVVTSRAKSHTEIVSTNYQYKCNDTQNGYDEVRGDDNKGAYTAYCCCYR